MKWLAGLFPLEDGRTFVAIIFAVTTVTFSQGLMIPWMATEQATRLGPLLNSVNTSDTYSGLLVAMLFVGGISRRIGLRNLIIGALVVGTATIIMLLCWDNAWWWFAFRFVYGVSLGAIHFGTQAWIGMLTVDKHRGKQMAVYGLATGIGFATGPLFLGTGKVAAFIPFVLSAMAFSLSLVLVLRAPGNPHQSVGLQRRPNLGLPRLYRLTLPALTLPLVFGFMESALNGDLPLFAQRVGMSLTVMSAALAAFVLGSLVLQYPLGYVSDRVGRRRVLTSCAGVGVIVFAFLPLAAHATTIFVLLAFIVGGFLDSLFSLSLGLLRDLVGRDYLAFANQIAVTNLGIGLMFGATVGGTAMHFLGAGGLFWVMAASYLLYVLFNLLWKPLPT